MRKSEKQILNKSIIRSILVLLALFSFMIGLLTIIESLTKNNESKESLISYDTIGKVSYDITLKENNLYEGTTIDDNHIISKYIDSINLYLNYNLYTSKKVNSEYTYKVKATLINSYNINNKKEDFLTKEFMLIDETVIPTQNTSQIVHNEMVELDYDTLNNLAKDIRDESGVLTSAKVKIEFILSDELEIIGNNKEFTNNHTITVEFPLLENITSIDKTGEFEEKENLYEEKENKINSFQLTIGILLVIVSIGFIYTAIKMILDINNISYYLIEKNKILKRYGDIIAETSTKPDFKGLEIMEITNIIDLVNIEDELRIPIIYYEVLKDKESWFVIIHNDKVYRYILRKKKSV